MRAIQIGLQFSKQSLIAGLTFGWLSISTVGFSAAGDLAWTNSFGDFSWEDQTGAITANSKAVFAAGSVSDGSGNWDWLVSAYDSANGTPLWQRQFGKTNSLEDARAIGVVGTRVLVTGISDNGNPGACDWITCAFDTRNGNPLWTNRFVGVNAYNVPAAMAINGSRAFIAGQAGSNFAVRAFNTMDGSLLWQDSMPATVSQEGALSIAADGVNVYAAGYTFNGQSTSEWVVRAYNARNGKLLWQDKFNTAGLYDDAFAIAASDGIVYAVGVIEDANRNSDWLVKAYDGATGRVLWQDRVDKSGSFDEATAVTVSGRTVYVAGISDVGGQGLPADYHWLVRAYNGKNGSLLWEDSARTAGGLTAPKSISLTGTSLCVSGSIYDLQNGSDWLLRVYNTRAGALSWENQYDYTGFWDDVRGMAVGPKSVYMFGLATDAQTTIVNWMVRSYLTK